MSQTNMNFPETQFPIRHFLDLKDISAVDLRKIIDTSRQVKEDFKRGIAYQPLPGKVLAMIFEKSSTRTRVSFEVAIRDLGGHAIIMSERDMQLGRGETLGRHGQSSVALCRLHHAARQPPCGSGGIGAERPHSGDQRVDRP